MPLKAGRKDKDKAMLKRLITGALIALMLAFCGQLDIYRITVTATNHTITGTTTAGEPITLTECRTADGERVLLENVAEGHTYIVTLDSFGTWSKEDDAIVRIRERNENHE